LRAAGYDELRRIIREEEPARPSTRLSTLGQAAVTVSANRQSDPRRLNQLCRGGLDWIVMKCLGKDRNRPYDAADALARDVERYLRDEPVQACPPSAWYRARKFVRRNKAALAACALTLLFVVLLVGGGGWVVWDRVARQARIAAAVQAALEEAQRLQREGKWRGGGGGARGAGEGVGHGGGGGRGAGERGGAECRSPRVETRDGGGKSA